MSPNTKLRFASAAVLVALAIFIISLEPIYGKVCLGLFSLLIQDEFLVNFFSMKRTQWKYIGIMLANAVLYSVLVLLLSSRHTQVGIIGLALFYNLFLSAVLFLPKRFSFHAFRKWPSLSLFNSLLPLVCVAYLLSYFNWRASVLLLLIIVFVFDSAAWFFGKNFGKKKLWPSVSPNKTQAGLFYGCITSCFFGQVFFYYTFDEISWISIPVFLLLAMLAQIGDLVQSRIKREFDLKDSSQLIPGHGGVYDRIDGLVFVTPFYALYTYWTPYFLL